MRSFTQLIENLTEEVKPDLGLEKKENTKIVAEMKTFLADLHVFSIKNHQFHWNVTGPFFGPLHKLFDDVYDHTQEHIDKIAERVRQVGGVASGSMKEFLNVTTLKEETGELREPPEMLQKLVADLEALSQSARKIVIETKSDQGTLNMLAGMVEVLDKDAWFVRAHMKE